MDFPGLAATLDAGLLAALATTLLRLGFLTEAVRAASRDLDDFANVDLARLEGRLLAIGLPQERVGVCMT